MIIPDLNLVLYAHVFSDPRHGAARQWWDGLLAGSETVGIPLAVSVGFVRLATSPVVVSPPMTSAAAIGLVQGWFGRPHFIRLDSGPDHFTHMARCLEAAGTTYTYKAYTADGCNSANERASRRRESILPPL